MAFTIPSVAEFKAQFFRDFPYAVPAYGADGTITLAAGIITLIGLKAAGVNYQFAPQVSVIDPTGSGAVVTATVANGGVTGFVVAAGGTNYTAPVLVVSGGAGDETDKSRVKDADINGAIKNAQFNCNQALFDTQDNWAYAFNFLVAHCLVKNLGASGQGMRGQNNWLVKSKTAGDISESFEIPENIKQSSFLSSLGTTLYGARYLEIISPLLIGNMGTHFRRTPP